jgi:hypothetical protein
MAKSGNPAAATLAASLYQKLNLEQREAFFEPEVHDSLISLSQAANNHPVVVAEVQQIDKRLAFSRNAVGPTASPWSILAFSYEFLYALLTNLVHLLLHGEERCGSFRHTCLLPS